MRAARSGRRAARRPRASVTAGSVEIRPDPDLDTGWFVDVDGVPSSYVDTADPENLPFEYVRWMSDVVDVLAVEAAPLASVHLGGAGCTLPRYLAATRPGSPQLVFEVDADVAATVRATLGGAGFRVRVRDGLAGLASLPEASRDLVVRDAFAGPHTPAHLSGPAFVCEVARVLRPSGAYLANIADGSPLDRARAEARAARAVLGHVALLAEPGVLRGRRYGNLVLVASRMPLPSFARRAASSPIPARVLEGEEMARFMGASPA